MSPPSSSEQPPLGDQSPPVEQASPGLASKPRRFRKPRPDLYTVMLAIALLALIIGCICFVLELQTFDYQTSGGPTPSAQLMPDRPPTPARTALCAVG